MDQFEGIVGDPDSYYGDQTIRDGLGYARYYADKMDLIHMTPTSSSSACSTRYCIRNEGKEYLVYQPNSGSFTVNLPEGEYTYEWMNPDNGNIIIGGNINGDGNVGFTPPFSGDAVLYLKLDVDIPISAPTGLRIQ